jgi:hypothetical protein
MMQEDALLHERDRRAQVRDPGAFLLRPDDQLIGQLARQPLRLAPRQLQR